MSSGAVTRGIGSFARRIRAAVDEVQPGARVVLYGSRARGNASSDSDWDLLVLLNKPVTRETEEKLLHRLFELELDADAVISVTVHSKDEWDSPLYRAMPFHENVTREGIPL